MRALFGSAAVLLALATLGRGPDSSSARRPHGCAPLDHQMPRWARKRQMTVLFDSVLLSGAPELRPAMHCWRVGMRGRPALMVRVAERELRARRRRVAPLVVIGLGYNSLWERHRHRYSYWAARFDREARRLLRTLHRLGARQFVWVTLRQPTRRTVPLSAGGELGQYSWYFPYVNERLRRLGRRRRDLVLADWHAVSQRRGLTYDSIHLNSRGARLMARTIKATIRDEARRQALLP
jgi:hypothetical protein